ncbi:MAG: DUF92 domain-containing protein [Puia sp.]|nr:DUF92 domain-containing protein [Puia sp.]
MIFLVAGAVYSVKAHKLTLPAALTGAFLALAVFAGGGYTGLAMMAGFFFAGTAATSWKLSWKRQQGLAEHEKGTRTAGQVFANAGVAAFAGLAALLAPFHAEKFQLLIAAAFAAASSDTLSSELGNVYGRRFYSIIGFGKGERGRDGVISLEGSLCGLAGAVLIAGIYLAGGGLENIFCPRNHFSAWTFRFKFTGIIVVAGITGNIVDSLLGATWERKQYIGNNAVNLLNTAAAALCAWLLNGIL